MAKRSKTPKNAELDLDLVSPTARLLILIAEQVAKRIRAANPQPADRSSGGANPDVINNRG